MYSESDANLWGIIFALYTSYSFYIVGKLYWQEFVNKKEEDTKFLRVTGIWALGLIILLTLYKAGLTPLGLLIFGALAMSPLALKECANKNRAKVDLAPWTFASFITAMPKSRLKAILFGCGWLIYVTIRTNFFLEVFGISLKKWNSDYFLINTGLGILVIFCMFNFQRLSSWLRR